MGKVGAFTSLRLLVSLKRIWQQLKRIADAQEAMLKLQQERAPVDVFREPRKAEIGHVSVEDLNEAYRKRHGIT